MRNWLPDDLRSDLRLYRRLVGSRLRSQMQYRASFMTMMIVTGFGLFAELIATAILLNRFGDLAGWGIGEVALLYGLASVSFGLGELAGAGFDAFPATIRRGEFDHVLLRPAGAFMQVLSADFQLRRLGRIGQGIVALGLAFSWTSIDWTPLKMLFLGVTLISGMVMFIALFVFGAALCFWTVESIEVINSVTDGGNVLASYPLPIYHELMQRVFTFIIPLAFVSYIPAVYLLDRPEANDWPSWLPLLSPLAALLLALAARVAWGVGVRHYRSTGS
ncbi:MAG TPA: ABC-2 family transporter protein [Thermomicrobiales bacterium]|nr:ABC-2 family transporter protein [Thermomicrobiales bacterium]